MENTVPTGVTYSDFVGSLVKPGSAIVKELDASKANLWHLATGASGEAGELLDAIKKHAIYNKALDLHNVVEELGDLEFYMEGIRQAIGVSRGEVLAQNVEKLSRRYHSGSYSDKHAQERADKS